MPVDTSTAILQMDEVLNRFREVELDHQRGDEESQASWMEASSSWIEVASDVEAEMVALLTHTIERFRPLRTMAYGDEALARVVSAQERGSWYRMRALAGILTSLRAEYQAGRLQSFRELVHADLFADFLEMASHLLEQGYKDAAEVTAGAVLEEHIRKLCGLHAVPTTFTDGSGNTRPKKLDTMNADLAKAGAYGKIEQQSVTAWAAIRNAAAHADYAKYTADQVRMLIEGVRGFITRHSA